MLFASICVSAGSISTSANAQQSASQQRRQFKDGGGQQPLIRQAADGGQRFAAVPQEQAIARIANTITRDELMAYVRHLADDSLEGRESASRGGRAAGNLLVEYFSRFGLEPMGDNGGYFQEFDGGQRNILGYVPGNDEKLRQEFVMIGAHYDHVGYGTPRNSFGPTGYIHNGADDNASGVAALLEIMQAIHELKNKPERSIIFAMWDGEEKGLLGSKDWVQNRLSDPNRVRLYINMDMVGRLRKSKLEVYGVRTSSGLRRLISQENSDQLNLDFNWAMREDSDHYSFWKKEMPSVMFHTGLHDQYHRPSDDVELINVDGMLQVSRLVLRVLVSAANQRELKSFRKESWNEGDAAKLRFELPIVNRPSRLGVRVADDESLPGPVTVTSVVAESVAAAAGIKSGDRIAKINGFPVNSRADLMEFIRISPKQCSLSLLKAGEQTPATVDVELYGNPIRIGVMWRVDEADPTTVYVVKVDADTPASRAGVAVGDRIYRLNGRSFASSDELLQVLAASPLPLEFELENQGKLRTVRLQSSPAVSQQADK